MGQEKDREITQQLTITGKTDSAWGNKFDLLPMKSE